MRLGIDFGTTRTVVAAATGGRYPVASFERPDGYVLHLPGLAAVTKAGRAYGWDAAATHDDTSGHDGSSRDASFLRSIKRKLSGMAPDDAVEGVGVTALELATEYLRHVADAIRQDSNLDIEPGEPLEVMVAVPATATTRQRYITLEAFRRAGFDVLGLINEPSAGAIEFAHRHLGPRSPKRYVVVYDLGGGTFDVTAVSLEGQRFDLLAADGIARLGGDDFDEAIFELALAAAGRSRVVLDRFVEARLLERCREAKEGLTPSSRRLLVDLPELGLDEPVVLSTAAVYERCAPLIARTIECTERVMEKLEAFGIDVSNPRELGAVYLVGGGAAFPAVGRILRQHYGRKLRLAPQPYAATAVGLAIAADEDAAVVVREAPTRCIGVWREGESGHEKVFDALIAKDQALPATGELRVERAYRPAHRAGHLRFVECARLDPDGQPEGELSPWSDIYFPYDPDLDPVSRDKVFGDKGFDDKGFDDKGFDDKGSDEVLRAAAAQRAPEVGRQEIVETYSYGRDGSVRLVIENRTQGYQQAYELGALR